MPHSSPTPTSTPQAAATSGLLQDTPAPVPDLPMLNASNDSLPDTLNLGDVALFTTAIGVHQLLSQAAAIPQVVQEPHVVTSESAHAIDLPQLVINPSQLTVEPPQMVIEPPQTVVQPPQTVIKHSQSATESSPSVSKHPKVVPMDTQPDSTVPPLPSQLLTKAVNTTLDGPMPGVLYWVRNMTAMLPGEHSQRGSIDGAPEMVVDDEEITVDLCEYINMESDDETHISSSQKTSDKCQELSLPPPGPQQ